MDDKGILGIENRTENWKSAIYFSQLFRGRRHLVAKRLGGESDLGPREVKLELFWKGMRDFLYQNRLKRNVMEQELGKLYKAFFSNLRADVEDFRGFQTLRLKNYNTSAPGWLTSLFNNLRNTEVDVVVESPDTLFVGEAKHEMSFGANSNHFLVHQLIRQYVMATILVELSPRSQGKKVIPFVVGDDFSRLIQSTQVKFSMSQGWLRAANVLTWEEIASLK